MAGTNIVFTKADIDKVLKAVGDGFKRRNRRTPV